MSVNFTDIVNKANLRWKELTDDKPWIRVGGGSSGQAAGFKRVYETISASVMETGLDVNVSIVGSLGLMSREPVIDVTIDAVRIFFGNMYSEDADRVVRKMASRVDLLPDPNAFAVSGATHTTSSNVPRIESLPEWNVQVKIATRNFGHIDPGDILQYIASGGYSALFIAVTERTPEDIVNEVKASGLRGRGGAAFPAGVKWSFLAPSKAPMKYVLCNCEEGDPGAFNDKGILESDPHTLLEGLILNGYATRSHKGYVFIRHGHDLPIEAMRTAISQAYEYGLLGKNLFGSTFSFDVEVALTGDSYVAGEETALMEAIEGKRSTPRFKPPFPAAAGLWEKPTNINNVKTLSYVPWIISNGSDAFKNIGTSKSSGTAILCLSGHISRPGLYEVPMGITIREALEKAGGGTPSGRPIKLLQTGGPLGGVMGEESFDTPIDFDAMSKAGAILGSGGLIVCDETVDTVDLIRNLVAFNQFESCGKCFPCRLGNTHMLEMLDRMCKREARPDDLQHIEKIGRDMKAGSLCGHGQLGFNPISSALRHFEEEFTERLNGYYSPSPKSVAEAEMILPTRTRP